MSTLQIKNLHVQVVINDGPKSILKGVDLTIDSNQVHVIISPNGSDRSTLAYSIARHPDCKITDDEVLLDDVDLLEVSVDERAHAGFSLAIQRPVEVPGVTVANSLHMVETAIDDQILRARQWVSEVDRAMKNLRMDPAFSRHDINAGFSGDEKERFGILQTELLRPRSAILDEVGSGLGVDALRIVSEGVSHLHDEIDAGFLLITHCIRILCYTKPDHVHAFVDEHVAETGDPDLVDRLEKEGYDRYLAWQSSPCRGQWRRAMQQGTIAGPSIETGGLRFLVTSNPVIGDHVRSRPASNRKDTP